MLSRWVRSWGSALLAPLLAILSRAGISPNTVTLAALATVCASALCLAWERPTAGAFLLLLGGALDGIDGELARHGGCQSPFGSFLDSICDHLGDFAVSLALFHLSLQRALPFDALLVFVAQFGSLFGSQVRSRAGMVGIETAQVGLFTRFERIVVLALGLFSGQIRVALCILALCTNISALQRTLFVMRSARLR